MCYLSRLSIMNLLQSVALSEKMSKRIGFLPDESLLGDLLNVLAIKAPSPAFVGRPVVVVP
jgi:hypothetical protein